jgi:hypothetical protein
MIFYKHGFFFLYTQEKGTDKISPSPNRDEDAGNYNQYYFTEPSFDSF